MAKPVPMCPLNDLTAFEAYEPKAIELLPPRNDGSSFRFYSLCVSQGLLLRTCTQF